MKHKKILDVIGTISLAIGFGLAFLPHAIHAGLGLDSDTSHVKHVISGIAVIVIALLVLGYNNKALKFMK